ncbi:hypothetical protein MD484_g6902, partial [Candolleomyces efflorescens]
MASNATSQINNGSVTDREEIAVMKADLIRLQGVEQELVSIQHAMDELRMEHDETLSSQRALVTVCIDVFSHLHYAFEEVERARDNTSWRSVNLGLDILNRAKVAIRRFTHEHAAVMGG